MGATPGGGHRGGLGDVALRYLARHHDPAHVVFVDGWTGKGTITGELRRALARAATDGPRFPAQLAVLADPGHCAHLYGTCGDALIPSACLNATISGLVSRYLVASHDWPLPAGWVIELTHWAHACGWELSATGRTVHLVPATGWTHPTVTRARSTGVAASEEILHWLLVTTSGNVHKHP